MAVAVSELGQDRRATAIGGSARRAWGAALAFRTVASVDGIVRLGSAALFGMAILATVAAAHGAFRWLAPVILFAVAGTAPVLAVAVYRRRVGWAGDRYDLMALAAALAFALTQGVLHHQHVAAESDIGFYNNDALIMATTGGRALVGAADATLPGFTTDEDGSRLLIMFGHSAFAALFGYAAGPGGVQWANAPLAFLTILALYVVGRRVAGTWGPLIGVGFYATSFVTVWLGRFAITENAATLVFLVSAIMLLDLAEKWRPDRASILALAATFGGLVRPEGVAVALWFAALAIGLRRHDLARLWRDRALMRGALQHRGNRGFLATLSAGAVALIAVAASRSMPRNYLSQSLDVVLPVLRGRPRPDSLDVPITAAPVPAPDTGPDVSSTATWSDFILRYEWDAVSAYFLPWFLAVVAVGLVLRLLPWRKVALLGLIALPYAIFILMPPVTTEQPFYMRRLWIAWLPLTYLLAGVTLDFVRAAQRWPHHTRRGKRPRWDAAILAGIVGLVILVPHLDVVSPVFDRRADDGSRDVLAALGGALPPDAPVVIDEDLTRYSTPIRVQLGNPAITFYRQPALAFQLAFLTARDDVPTYILRLNSTTLPVMEADRDGSVTAAQFRVEAGGTPTNRHLEYISQPPLRQGYAPIKAYLDRAVPPDRWVEQRFDVALVETLRPLVLQKNIDFGLGWQRTDRGLTPSGDNGTLNLDLRLYSSEIKNRTNFAIYLAYHQVHAGTVTLTGLREGEGPPRTFNLTSDGSGSLRFAVWSLPVPADLRLILVPQGTFLRGIFFGLDHGLPNP